MTKRTRIGIALGIPVDIILGHSLDDKAFQGKTMSKINNALYDYEKLDQGVTIAANKERKLVRIFLHTSELDAGKGIKVGSTVQDAIKTFGESYYKRKDEQSAEPVTGMWIGNSIWLLSFGPPKV
jgi:hypothetical protein